MKTDRIMIAAVKSGSGKTTVTCALLQALMKKEIRAVSFKCGPDYIDPMFHEQVIGVPSYNLDTFFTGEDDTRKLFEQHAAEGEVAVLEGVMGLYDGLGGVREEGSSYHLAKVTDTPVVLVADVKGMGRSVLPMIAGFLSYDTECLIRGVILNRISKGYYDIIKPLIEKELRLPVMGFLPEREEFHIGSRHLGLVMPGELADRKEKLKKVAEEFERTVSVPAIMEIAKGAKALKEDRNLVQCDGVLMKQGKDTARQEDRPVIAVAKDEAFCFYYADNLRMLEEHGAEIRYFSPLHDQALPEECHGILIGGGYPELHAEELSRNIAMCSSVKQAMEKGMPVVAECGGFMYLHSVLTDRSGADHTMAGAVLARCFDTGRLVRFGYIELQEKEGYFLPEGEKIKGHEFHYYDSNDNGDSVLAVRPATGKRYSCVMTGETYWIGFPHLYYPSNPVFVKSFVEKVRRYRNNCYGTVTIGSRL